MSAADRRILLALSLAAAWLAGVSVYEMTAFEWHPAREEAPGASAWHWMRSAITGMLAVAVAAALNGARTGRTPTASLPGRWLAFSCVTLGLSIALLALLLIDPQQFHLLAAEDGPIEWLSALLLFTASGFALLWTRRVYASHRDNRGLHLFAAAGLAALFFLMAMEEISWFQRQAGFATPRGIAEANWQGEFNLHNFHTDLTELALYSGTGVFLVLLPLVRESIGHWRGLRAFAPLMPDRTVAAISAPMLALTYGQWNLLPVQFATWAGMCACIAYAATARGGERATFAALAAFIAGGQALVLATGHRMTAIYDASEFREAYLALGLAVYAWRQWRSSRGPAGA